MTTDRLDRAAERADLMAERDTLRNLVLQYSESMEDLKDRLDTLRSVSEKEQVAHTETANLLFETTAELDALKAERGEINTSHRLLDLVRYQRAELHQAELLTDEEYAWLCYGSDMATSPKGGSPSRQRLEDYDELRATVSLLTAERDALKAELAAIAGQPWKVTRTH
jgi:hypothetical protein